MNLAAIAQVEKSGTTEIVYHSSAGDTGKSITYADQATRDAMFTAITDHLDSSATYRNLT